MKRNTTIAATVAACMLLTACGGGDADEGGQGAGNGAATGTVTLLTQDHPWTRALEPYFEDFEEETGLTLEVTSFAEEQARDRTLLALESGSSEFDVFMSLKSREGQQYADAGHYEDLTSYVEQAPDSYNFDDFAAGPIEGETINGQLTGIPIIVEGPVMFYRTDLFDEYGIDVPETLEELVDAAATIAEESGGDIAPVTLRGLPSALPYTFGPFFHGQGIEWVDDSGNLNFDTPEAVTAIEQYATLGRDYGPDGVGNFSFTQSSALFAQGQAAIEIESSNELSTIMDPEGSRVTDEIGVAPIPGAEAGERVPTVLAWGISMSAYSQNKDGAWEFIQWATSPEMQLKLALDGIASPRTSTADEPEYQDTLDSETRQEWQEALSVVIDEGSSQVAPPGKAQPEIREMMGTAISAVMLGQQSADEAAQQIQNELPAIMESGGDQ